MAGRSQRVSHACLFARVAGASEGRVVGVAAARIGNVWPAGVMQPAAPRIQLNTGGGP